MTIADETYTDCGEHQEPAWWTERCAGCDHGLMVHRTNLETQLMVCDMCALAAEVTSRAQDFAHSLKSQAVAYVDKEISASKTVVRQYVDDQDAKIRTDTPVYVNNRLVQVIKPTSFQSDPRTAP